MNLNWIFFTLGFVLICAANSHGATLNFLLIVEKDDSLPKLATRKGLEAVNMGENQYTLGVIEIDQKFNEAQVCEEIVKNMKNATLAMDATKQGNPSENRVGDDVKAILRKMGIPTVSVTPTYSPWPGAPLSEAEEQYLIKILPPEITISQVVKSITDLIGMQKLAIVYDETFAYKAKAGLLFDNIPSGIAMEPINIKDKKSFEATMTKLSASDLGNLFVFASCKTLKQVMESAFNKKMFSSQFAWFAITMDDSSVICDVCADNNVIVIKPTVVNSAEMTGFANAAIPSDDKVNSAFYFDLIRLIAQILLENVGKTKDWPEDLTYPESCEAALTEEAKTQRAGVKLRSALEKVQSLKGVFGDFKMKSESKTKTIPYQSLKMDIFKVTLGNKKTTGLDKPELSWQFKLDVPGKKALIGSADVILNHKAVMMLRITTMIDKPFIYKFKNADGTDKWDGYCIDLIELIKQNCSVKFEYRIFENKDKKHGQYVLSKTQYFWNGMIADIVNGRADLALAPMAVMVEREAAVDFTASIYDMVGISILMRRILKESSFFKFLTVLESNVWGCILAAYFFTSFLMYLFDRLSPYSFHNNQEKFKDDEETRDFSLKESLWFCITSLTPQGGGEAPRNLSGRLVAATWWLFGFIIIASYTANLAAFLTVSRLDSTIEDLDDLARQYKIKYATVEHTTAHSYFERMSAIEERFYEIWKNMSLDDTLNETERAKLAVWDYPVSDKYTKIWWTMQETKHYSTFEEGLGKTLSSTKESGYATLAESTKVKYATMENCEFRQVGPDFSRKPVALALTKGSILREPLSTVILQLMNQRKLEELKDKWWNFNPYQKKCYHYEKRNDGIEFDNIGGIFLVMGIGIAMGVGTLILEFIYFKTKRATTKVVKVANYLDQNQPTTKEAFKR